LGRRSGTIVGRRRRLRLLRHRAGDDHAADCGRDQKFREHFFASFMKTSDKGPLSLRVGARTLVPDQLAETRGVPAVYSLHWIANRGTFRFLAATSANKTIRRSQTWEDSNREVIDRFVSRSLKRSTIDDES